MRWMLVALICMLLCGCEQKKDYSGTVEVKKVNGVAANVIVTLPRNGSMSIDIDNREDMSSLILSLETILVDLKAAREELPMSQATQTQPVAE